jgi:hypothetical protein
VRSIGVGAIETGFEEKAMITELPDDDLEILEAADRIRELYRRLVALEDHGVPEPQKHVQTSGGVCRGCDGWTTYTRQNSAKGLCTKCETRPRT